MELCDPADDPKPHKWLQWLGLQEPPAGPNSWVPVARGLRIDDRKTGTSVLAITFVELLRRAGVEALQRSYEFYYSRPSRGDGFPVQRMDTRVAVLVHTRDRARAIELAVRMNEALRELRLVTSRIWPDELARQALAAGPPPEAQ
jgi:hypothetical protein